MQIQEQLIAEIAKEVKAELAAIERSAKRGLADVLGFAIGIAGLDRRFDDPGATFAVASRGDLGSIVFEPEPLTGARP